MKLRPLHNWVVIERNPLQTEEKGFFLPSSPSNQGTVLAVGPLAQSIEVGERIQFNPYAGFVITVAEMTVCIIRPADIVGVLTA